MSNSRIPSGLGNILSLVLGGFFMFFVAALPNEQWSPAWGNFFGAAFVAVGGLLASLHTYKLVLDWAVPISWALIVMGGFAIAGASLQMALA